MKKIKILLAFLAIMLAAPIKSEEIISLNN
ncbi:hypothetical protein J2Z64_003871 [Oceanobacillus polygoni]|uniref:Uncharacterized protein n=1 Tax=Oceanobacillus polygoni TaxID=1235259 RepID=A0A9X1CKV6_9BACI|nr:hypothetical protein [Oceanobacillus polygoni]